MKLDPERFPINTSEVFSYLTHLHSSGDGCTARRGGDGSSKRPEIGTTDEESYLLVRIAMLHFFAQLVHQMQVLPEIKQYQVIAVAVPVARISPTTWRASMSSTFFLARSDTSTELETSSFM